MQLRVDRPHFCRPDRWSGGGAFADTDRRSVLQSGRGLIAEGGAFADTDRRSVLQLGRGLIAEGGAVFYD